MTANRLGIITIQKRTVPEWLVWFIFFFPFFMAFLIEFLNIPSFIKYSVDIAYMVSFMFIFFRRKTIINRKIMPFVIFIIAFLIYTFITYLFNFQSPFYYIWGFRNNFRFYIVFILFTVFFDDADIKKCFNFLDLLFWINVTFSFFQFIVLGYEQDYLGGIFGVEKGCNAFTFMFFSLVISKSVLSFMNKTEKTLSCLAKCSASLVVAAMAELKFYFILFVFILAFSAIITRFSFRKFLFMLVLTVILIFASLLLATIFKDDGMLSLDGIIEMVTASNYATAKDLGRFTAIPTISNNILTEPLEKIFGLGLGNCDTSSFAICNTPFYQAYSYLHYMWFSSAMLFLEIGYIGLITYILFYILCFVFARKNMKNQTSNELYCQISMIMSMICIIMVFYTSALRTEAAYISFFALSLPFIGKGNLIHKSENTDIKC